MIHVRLERQLAGLGRSSPTRPLLEALAQDMRRTDLGANLVRSGLGLSGGFLFHEVSRAFAKKTLIQIPLQSIVWLWVIPIASTLTPGVQLAEIQSCSYLDSSA